MLLRADDSIEFAFPGIHRDAVLRIDFQRTLRVPDDGQRHYLPPGLGRFPLREIDELDPARVPEAWLRRGGVVMPMWQAEACWLNFSSPHDYPFLLKVAAGKINAVNGAPWRNEPDFDRQDYVEVPGQPWLDGFRMDERTVRQFVAMPLGRGYTVEEQATGEAEWGGVQLLAHPLKAEVWEGREERRSGAWVHAFMAPPRAMGWLAMGLGAGGSIRQEIERAEERRQDWDLSARARCFVHLANSQAWRGLTGEAPPTVPPSAADYTRAGLPWFDLYSEEPPATLPPRPSVLRRIRSVLELSRAKGETALPENVSFRLPRPVRLRRRNRLEGIW